MLEILKKDKLKTIEDEVNKCSLCPISALINNHVFGTGSPDAKLMFIGEAPGRDEDLQGKPFVGLAGQLLTKIIESIGLKREEVYIANIIKCRPPENRNPEPDEINNCKNYLREQIKIIQPEIICALGKFAAQTLLKTEAPISSLRGNFYPFGNMKIIPTFHPAYLLRNQSGKKFVWEDMKKIREVLKCV